MRRALLLVACVVSFGSLPGGVAAAAPKVLLTGDSMMENIGDELGTSLKKRGASSVLDQQAGSGLTIPVLDWVTYAERQMATVRPDVTVMFNGAGDVYPLDLPDGGVAGCCGAAWRGAYGAKVEAMMRTYRAGGHVFWLTLPMPRNRGYQQVLAAVNRSVVDAGRRTGRRVTIVDLVPTLTPGRRYRRTMRWRGKVRVVRAADGIHLADAGSAIVVAKVVAAMQRADVL